MNIKKAVIINALGKYSVVVIQLIVTAILSRILSPEDYGIIAVVTVFSTFFSTLSNMGFGTAIIQNKDLTDDDVNNIYSFTVYVAIVLSFTFAMFSFLIAWFYNDSVYIQVTMLLSISLLFNALNMVPNGILNKEKKFVSIAVRTVTVYVGAAVIAIILAKLGFRYYALVIQFILSAFFTFLWNYISTKPKFKFKVNIDSIKKVANYSGFQFAFNFVNYFASNLDNLLTGKFLGHRELGFYNKAYNLSLYPINNLTGVISPVLHPILSDYQNDKSYIYNKYIQIVNLLLLVGAYIQSICFLAGGELINIMFGSNWNECIICFKLLSFCIVFRLINSCSGAIFQALGNTKLLFENSVLNTIISITAILMGLFVFGNIAGLSACISIAYLFHYITASVMLIKFGFSFSVLSYFKDIIKSLMVCIIMVALSLIDFIKMDNMYLSLILKGLYITVMFVTLIIITKTYRCFVILKSKKSKEL